MCAKPVMPHLLFEQNPLRALDFKDAHPSIALMDKASFPPYRYKGLAIAAAIFAAWSGHLVYALTLPAPDMAQLLSHIAIQTFLNVGLFITAHDAIHRSVAPGHKRLNDAIGAAALFLYGGFLWPKMRKGHFAHHANPATQADPDYAPNAKERMLPWLARFVTGYYSWRNFALMHIHIAVAWALSGALWKVLIFVAVPAWLSAFQLFYFGTYLPHRTPAGGHTDPHKTQSNDYPAWLSFLTCYHFGYHEEHHHHPQVPWWRLARLRRMRKAAAALHRAAA